MANREDIIARIEKALRLAADPGATEGEREAARAAADSLMRKYDVEEAEFRLSQSTTDMRKDIIMSNIRITKDGEVTNFVPEERLLLAHYIAQFFDCKTIVQQMAPTADMDTGKPVAGGKFLSLIGFRSDVDATKGLYNALVLHLVTESAKEQQRAVNYMRSWAQGYAETVNMRLREMKAMRDKNAHDSKTSDGHSTALVLVKKSDMVTEKYAEMFPNAGSYSSRGPKLDPTGYARGGKAARSANLGNNVGGASSAGQVGPTRRGLPS